MSAMRKMFIVYVLRLFCIYNNLSKIPKEYSNVFSLETSYARLSILFE